MHRLRPEQMKLIGRTVETRFVDRLLEFLHEQFGEAAYPSPERRTRVGELVERAQGYGLSFEDDIAVFVVAAEYFGPEFDAEYLGALTILLEPQAPSELKAARLQLWVKQQFAESRSSTEARR